MLRRPHPRPNLPLSPPPAKLPWNPRSWLFALAMIHCVGGCGDGVEPTSLPRVGSSGGGSAGGDASVGGGATTVDGSGGSASFVEGTGGQPAPLGGATLGGAATDGGSLAAGSTTGSAISGGAGTGGSSTIGGMATGGEAAMGGVAIGGAAPTGGAISGGGPADLEPNLVEIGEDTLALSGLTAVSYGGYVNGESFQQDAVVTHAGHQYAAFWNTERHVVLARRRLPADSTGAPEAWQKFDFTDYSLSADDAHNTISLGVAPGDGTLHLAFDHHDSTLHYRRSVPGLLTNPDTAVWNATSFGAVTSTLVEPTPVTKLTYPRFVTEPGGARLLLSARIGQSGSGDEFLWEYDTATHAWSSLGEYLRGTDVGINAYLHGLVYTRGGSRLHAAWCWRATPDPTTNHDLLYVYSDDHGRTWYNDAGQQLGTTGSTFVTRDAPGLAVWSIPQHRGLINQEHLAVDASGRVHVLLSHLPDAAADDDDFASARSRSEFFHYLRELDGTWHRHSIGLPTVENFRGKLAISSAENVYAILPDLRIVGASKRDGYSHWTRFELDTTRAYFSDPLIDTTRLETSDLLTVIYPERSSPNIWSLDFAVR